MTIKPQTVVDAFVTKEADTSTEPPRASINGSGAKIAPNGGGRSITNHVTQPVTSKRHDRRSHG